MSGVSKGTQTATNTFIVLGTLALIALAITAGRKPTDEPARCDERLLTMGPIVWDPQGAIPHPGESHSVTLDYRLTPNGDVADITVSGTESDYDSIAINALTNARFQAASSGAEDQLCRHVIRLQLD